MMPVAVDLEQSAVVEYLKLTRAALHRNDMFDQHPAGLSGGNRLEDTALSVLAQSVDIDCGGEQTNDQRHHHEDEADQDELEDGSGSEESHAQPRRFVQPASGRPVRRIAYETYCRQARRLRAAPIMRFVIRAVSRFPEARCPCRSRMCRL